jgi:NADP-dependent 3-hydroxy acid dehydrogenase YdfG
MSRRVGPLRLSGRIEKDTGKKDTGREVIMGVFVAGATGAIGHYLVPGLIAAGHEVTGSTRWRDGFPEWVQTAGQAVHDAAA